MASSSNPTTFRLSRSVKNFLHDDPEAIKAYTSYVNYGKVSTGCFAIFDDFPTYNLQIFFLENGVLDVIDASHNDYVCYPNLVKLFYANLNHNFYNGNDGEVWSSVNGTRIVLDCNLLGIILG